MRVALIGNLCNTAYNFAKMLRRKGIEADVFVSSGEESSPVGSPAWEDPEVTDSPPQWLCHYRDRNPASMVRLLGRLRHYDLVHAFAMPISFCHFAGAPVIAHALGADLKEVVYAKSLRGWAMRRGFAQARQILYSDLDHVPHVSKLKLTGARYLSAAVDTEKYSSGPTTILPDIDKGSLLFFHSSFLSWTGGGVTQKNNDRFFRAFARFARERPDVFLVAIEAGPDAPLATALVRDLGVDSRVCFVPPMDKAALLQHYRWCDVIVDQFGMPKLGVNALEGMSCGRPMMVSIDNETVSQCYAEPPPLYACTTEDEILRELKSIGTKEAARDRGTMCREWILRHHHWDRVTSQVIDVYEQVLGQH